MEFGDLNVISWFQIWFSDSNLGGRTLVLLTSKGGNNCKMLGKHCSRISNENSSRSAFKSSSRNFSGNSSRSFKGIFSRTSSRSSSEHCSKNSCRCVTRMVPRKVFSEDSQKILPGVAVIGFPAFSEIRTGIEISFKSFSEECSQMF